MTKSPMMKKMNAPMPSTRAFVLHCSVVDDSHSLHRPSDSAESGTYPSSHTAQSGPVAWAAQTSSVEFVIEHAKGFMHA